MPASKMRRAGFSRGKIRAIKHIARKARDGRVPTRRACHALADDSLIEQLTELH
jgi:DNA-3-methyladenine glycosylase II